MIRRFENPSKTFYTQFFLILVLFYFILTYTIINKDTIGEQANIIYEGSSLFAKTTTYTIFSINETKPGFNKETYEIEKEIFIEINYIRKEASLPELQWDPMLAETARKHSLDMARNKYLNHTNLFGMNPTQRAEELRIRTQIETQDLIIIGIGENIGLMPKGIVQDVGVLITNEDIAAAMIFKWMTSEGHRENILKSDYKYTGIGVVYDGKESYYITQNFQ